MAKILAIDTSSKIGNWSLYQDSKPICSDQFETRASASLFPSFHSCKQHFEGIEKILIGVGPGSFGGIRVGISAAQGLALGWSADLIPIRSSHALGWEYRHISFLGVFSDAKRQKYFFTAYEHGKMTRESQLIDKDEIDAYLSKCSLALSTDVLPDIPKHSPPFASHLIEYDLAHDTEELTLDPIYLHGPVN